MRKTDRRPMLFVIFAAMALSFAAPGAEAASFSWLAFLSKTERPKATTLVATVDATLASISEDYARAISSERSYANAARVLAGALDEYALNADALSLALSKAGQGGSSAQSAALSLADSRRLRWEVSRDIASSRYGHVSTSGFVTAETAEGRVGRAGADLRTILAKRIAPIPKKNLLATTKALEDRIAAHPDCPEAAFAALRAAAAQLEGPPYRAWMLALTSFLPGALAADSTVALGSTGAEVAYRAAKSAFVDAYASRMTLKEALSAAAAAAWYVDGYPSATEGRVSPQALASFASFLRNLASADPALVAASLAEDEHLSTAFAECSALAWVAYGRSVSRFAADLGLEPTSIGRALDVAWRATTKGSESENVVIDRDAVYRAETFAVRLRTETGAAGVFSIYAELLRDRQAFEAIRIGARYAPVRERVRSTFSGTLTTLSGAIEKEARKSSAASGFGKTAGDTAPQKSAESPQNEATFRLITSGDDPFSDIALAAVFERQVGGVAFRTAVPPSALASALGPFSPLIKSGTLVVTLPSIVEGKRPAADEIALLGAGLGWVGSGEAIAQNALERLSKRYGVPYAFLSIPSSAQNTARRFMDFGATSARFASVSGGSEQ